MISKNVAPILAGVLAVFGVGGSLVLASDTSPFMGLEIPAPGDPGPTWATNVQEALELIDAHDHSSGKGTKVTPAGFNVNADVEFNGNDLTEARTIRFNAADSATTVATDRIAIYASNGDLWWIDESGNTARVTADGSVNATPGSITGMSGSAGVAYSALTNTFAFTADDGTPALGDFSTVRIAEAVAAGKGPRLTSNAATAADYNFIFPSALPGANRLLCLNASGDLSTCTASAASEGLTPASIASTGPVSGTTITASVGGIGVASATGGTTRAAATTSNSTTTPSNVTGLSFTGLTANEVYFLNCAFSTQGAATTTGIQIGVDTSAAVTAINMECAGWDSAALFTRTDFNSDDGRCAMASSPTAGSGQTRITMSGYVEMSSPAADLTVRLRSEVGASQVTIFGGSTCTLTKNNI